MNSQFGRALGLQIRVAEATPVGEGERAARLLGIEISQAVVSAWAAIVEAEARRSIEAGPPPCFEYPSLLLLAAGRDAKWTAPFVAGLIRAEATDTAADEWRRWADMLIDSGEAADAA